MVVVHQLINGIQSESRAEVQCSFLCHRTDVLIYSAGLCRALIMKDVIILDWREKLEVSHPGVIPSSSAETVTLFTASSPDMGLAVYQNYQVAVLNISQRQASVEDVTRWQRLIWHPCAAQPKALKTFSKTSNWIRYILCTILLGPCLWSYEDWQSS